MPRKHRVEERASRCNLDLVVVVVLDLVVDLDLVDLVVVVVLDPTPPDTPRSAVASRIHVRGLIHLLYPC